MNGKHFEWKDTKLNVERHAEQICDECSVREIKDVKHAKNEKNQASSFKKNLFTIFKRKNYKIIIFWGVKNNDH